MNATTAPRERPILFSAPMVRAILAGTKTQTRRIMRPQPLSVRGSGRRVYADADFKKAWGRDGYGEGLSDCRYGQPSDRLWVRETFALESWTREFGDQPPLPTDGRPWKHVPDDVDGGDYWLFPHYAATDKPPQLSCERDRCRACADGDGGPHWRPSIHMPRWACRIVLEITDVRVQRLHDISEDDARDEGVDADAIVARTAISTEGPHRAVFRHLWGTINGDGAWDANPWVWAMTFRLVGA